MVTRSTPGCRARSSGFENASGIPKCRAAASADSWRVVQTAAISKSESACNAGTCATEANPRWGLNPTIPTRILLLSATVSSTSHWGTCRTRLVDGERLQGSTQGLDDAVAFGAGNDQRRAQRDRRAEAASTAGAADDDALVAAKIDEPTQL